METLPSVQQGTGNTLIAVCDSTLVGILSIRTLLLFLGLPEYPVDITSIEVVPDPPKPGQELTVKVDGIVTETLEVSLILETTYFLRVTSTGRSICRCDCEDWIN